MKEVILVVTISKNKGSVDKINLFAEPLSIY